MKDVSKTIMALEDLKVGDTVQYQHPKKKTYIRAEISAIYYDYGIATIVLDTADEVITLQGRWMFKGITK